MITNFPTREVLRLVRILSDGESERLVMWLRARPTVVHTVAIGAATGIRDSTCQFIAQLILGSQVLPEQLALAIEVARAAVNDTKGDSPSAEVVWTGPVQFSVPARSTLMVLLEMIAGACWTATLVGYSLSSGGSDVFRALAACAARGISVRVFADRLEEQLESLAEVWPTGSPYPELYTWVPPPDAPQSLLHAKLLVVDRKQALVTSANLTYRGLNQNVEVGVRLHGTVAEQIDGLFDELRGSCRVTRAMLP